MTESRTLVQETYQGRFRGGATLTLRWQVDGESVKLSMGGKPAICLSDPERMEHLGRTLIAISARVMEAAR